MAQLTLYRRIYSVGILRTGSTIDQVYTLVDPYSISATTFSTQDTSTILETFNSVNQESTGVYSVDINPYLYTWDKTYSVEWGILYTELAPYKKLLTTFRLNPINIGSEVEIEIISNPIEIELG